MVNPTTGVVLSKFVRTPDIDSKGYFNGKYLSTRSDKVHCSIADLEANACSSVASEVVDASEYRKHDKSGGYEGFSILDDGTIVAFLEKNSGDTTFSVSVVLIGSHLCLLIVVPYITCLCLYLVS